MKIFLDTNVALDYMQGRKSPEQVELFLSSVKKDTDNRTCVSYLSMANAAYVLRKQYSNEELNILFRAFTSECNVLPMNDAQLYEALRCGNPSPDFEDGLQIMCAEYADCDVIVTHNVDHFRAYTDIPAITPEDFISHCQKL